MSAAIAAIRTSIPQHAVDVRNSRDEDRGVNIAAIDPPAGRREGGAGDLDVVAAAREARGLPGLGEFQPAVNIFNALKYDGGLVIRPVDPPAGCHKGGARDRNVAAGILQFA